MLDCVSILRDWSAATEWRPRACFTGQSGMPRICDFGSSAVELIGDESLSLARIGDGELGLATGLATPNNGCQRSDASLRDALQRVMRCDNPACRVALVKAFFYTPLPNTCPEIDRFVRDEFSVSPVSSACFAHFRPGYMYLDASMTVVRKHYDGADTDLVRAYYEALGQLMRGRDILLVTGDMRYCTYDRSLLSDAGAGSVSVIKVPQRDAWAYHDRIRRVLLDENGSGSRLVCLCCGPTASVLAYDLADRMRCLDMGHVFGDYNLAMGGRPVGGFWE